MSNSLLKEVQKGKNSESLVIALFTIAPLFFIFFIITSSLLIEKYGFHMFFYVVIIVFIVENMIGFHTYESDS